MAAAWDLDADHTTARPFTPSMAHVNWGTHESHMFHQQRSQPTPHSKRYGAQQQVYVGDIVDAATLPESKGGYEMVDELGSGSFSTVYAVRHAVSKQYFALKVVSKQLVVKERKVEAVMREKDLLLALRPNPFVVVLQKTFQDPGSLFFLMSLCSNEDLFFWLQRYSCFDIPTARWYTGQLVLALEYIHSRGVVHRDLKPENILLDDTMRIKLADFGSAKLAPTLRGAFAWEHKASTFVGTAEYVSPEILNGKPAGPASDFWSLGAVLFRMLAGEVPFRAPNEFLIFQKIEAMDYAFPVNFPPDAAALVRALLNPVPSARLGLGQGCAAGIKEHAFFADASSSAESVQALREAPPPALGAYLPPLEAGGVHYYGLTRDDHSPYARVNVEEEAHESLQSFPAPDMAKLLDRTRLASVQAEQQASSPWAGYSLENECVVLGSKARWRRGYQEQVVFVVLFSSARMLILEAPELENLLDVNLCEDGEACGQLQTRQLLFLHTPRKTYYFAFEEPAAAAWVVAVQALSKCWAKGIKEKGEEGKGEGTASAAGADVGGSVDAAKQGQESEAVEGAKEESERKGREEDTGEDGSSLARDDGGDAAAGRGFKEWVPGALD